MCLFCTNPLLESTPEQRSFCSAYQTHVLSEAMRGHRLHRDPVPTCSEIEHYLFHGAYVRAFLYGTHFEQLDKARREQPASEEKKVELLKLHLKICFYAVRRKGMAVEKAVNEVERFYWGHIWDVGEWSDWSEEGTVAPKDVLAYIQEIAGMDGEMPVGLHWRLDEVLEQMGETW